MVKLLIIADDFTGALDTGAQLSKVGISTMVTTKISIDEMNFNDTQVLVVDSETRHLNSVDAKKIVLELCEQAKKANIKYIYKKTDSGLRGNIGAEIEALFDIFSNEKMMFVPAFPKNNRTTIEGFQYINGNKIAETELGKDIFNPVIHSYIPTIIKEQSKLDTIVYDENKKEVSIESGIINLFDCSSSERLEEIAKIAVDNNVRLFVGCAGFAEYLPKIIEFSKRKEERKVSSTKTLIVSGSINSKSLEMLSELRLDKKQVWVLNSKQKLDDKFSSNADLQDIAFKVAKSLDNDDIAALAVAIDESDLISTENYIEQNKLDLSTTRSRIVSNLAVVVKKILEKEKDITLVVFGGDTLYALFTELGVEGLIPYDEIEPGVVISKQINSKNFIISKAGAFGDKKTIWGIINYIKRSKE